jgi:hypothetical protein
MPTLLSSFAIQNLGTPAELGFDPSLKMPKNPPPIALWLRKVIFGAVANPVKAANSMSAPDVLLKVLKITGF